MKNDALDLIQTLQEQEREQIKTLPPRSPRELPGIPFAALPEAPALSPLATEWNFYRRVIARMLAEGHEGQWVLIKGEEIVGIWGKSEDADRVRVERFPLEPVLMKQILAREPIVKVGGIWRRWAS